MNHRAPTLEDCDLTANLRGRYARRGIVVDVLTATFCAVISLIAIAKWPTLQSSDDGLERSRTAAKASARAHSETRVAQGRIAR